MFPIHNTSPREMSVIGRLLVDYGQLELDLMNCVQVARSFDLNATLKVMLRVRGESNRFDIADGLGRTAYVAVNLEAEFDSMIAAMKHCLLRQEAFFGSGKIQFWCSETADFSSAGGRCPASLLRS